MSKLPVQKFAILKTNVQFSGCLSLDTYYKIQDVCNNTETKGNKLVIVNDQGDKAHYIGGLFVISEITFTSSLIVHKTPSYPIKTDQFYFEIVEVDPEGFVKVFGLDQWFSASCFDFLNKY